ncbi:MAG: 16S rRNA processing protein RimM [Clostridiales bacterium]|nr:16S rRNA processing protein RimM [Clostridiales bacterium]
MITVGQITKPQGVRGEVKVRPMTNDPSRFCVLKSAYIDGRLYKLSAVRVSGNDVYLRLSGVDDRNAAETLRGKYIEIDRAAAVALDDGEFFIDDLVGATLCARTADGSQSIGTIMSVQSFGSADVFTVQTERGEMTFAFVKALNAEYDEESNVLSVDGQKLKEVAVYDED